MDYTFLQVKLSLRPSFKVESIKSNESSLNSSAVIMPDAEAPSPPPVYPRETTAGSTPELEIDEYDADSVVSLRSSRSSFIDVEALTITSGTATSEDRDEFDFADETDEETADEL